MKGAYMVLIESPILVPGRPGDLRMIFNIAVEQTNLIRLEAERTGATDETALRSVAEAIEQSLAMWLGKIPVERSVLEAGSIH
jgi:hypothetical protein